jgi:hypothetical protein
MLVKATTVDNTTTYLPKGTYVVRIGNSTGSVENIALTVDEETVTIIYGDVNGDGEVTATDKTYLGRYLAEWDGYADKVDLVAADVNGDGEVTATDKTFLGRHLAEWSGYETLPKK